MTSIYEVQGVAYLNSGNHLGTCYSLEEAKGWAKTTAKMFPEYESVQVVDISGVIRARYKTKG